MSIFSPEQQVIIYKAVRDGNINELREILQIDEQQSTRYDINCRPFDSLWHDPGNESTLLHLACCCIQYEMVKFLLDLGADPTVTAQGLRPIDVVDKYDLFESARLLRASDVVKIKNLLDSSHSL